MHLPGERDRDKAIVDKIHTLTKERALSWAPQTKGPGYVTRHNSTDVIAWSRHVGDAEIVVTADASKRRFDPRSTHRISPKDWTEQDKEVSERYHRMIEEVMYLAERQYNGTDELVTRFLES